MQALLDNGDVVCDVKKRPPFSAAVLLAFHF